MASPYEQLMKAKEAAEAIAQAGGENADQARLDAAAIAQLAEELRGPSDPEAEPTSSFFGDVLGRVGVGQGLAMGYGDEIEAYARSAFTDETYEEAPTDRDWI